MRKFCMMLMAAALATTVPAAAQSVKSEVETSVGVDVTLYSDDFADRYEYSAPVLKLKGEDGFAIVSRVKTGGTAGQVVILGSSMYSGEWRFYDRAVFRGGAEVDFTRTDSKVISCRYGCTMREGFAFSLTAQDIERYNENGIITVQVRSKSSNSYLIEIPVSYIQAVIEASS